MITRAVFACAYLAASTMVVAPTASALTLPNPGAYSPCNFGAMSSGCGSNARTFMFKRIGSMHIARGNPSSSQGRSQSVSNVVAQASAASTPSTRQPPTVALPMSGLLLGFGVLLAAGVGRRRS